MKTLKTMGEILSMEKGQLKSWIDDVNASKESTIIVYIGSTKLSREVSVSIQNQFAKSRKQAALVPFTELRQRSRQPI
jgi:hypothetical protein